MRTIRIFFKTLLYLSLAVVLLFALFLAVIQVKGFDRLPLLKGYKPLIVLSGSMEPTLKVGSVVLVHKVNPDDIRVGDIITFSPSVDLNKPQPAEQTLTTHRVVRINDGNGVRAFETKGDANNDFDAGQVSESSVVGKAGLCIPYLGYISNYLHGKPALILLVATALGIMIFEFRNIFIQLRRRRYSGSY